MHEEGSDSFFEHSWGNLGQIVLAIAFFAVWLVDAFFLQGTVVDARVSIGVRLPLAMVNWLAVAYLARQSLRLVFDKTRDPTRVIRESVYGIVRHPLYLSEMLLYPGFLLCRFSLAACGIWLLGAGFLHILARYEEKQLVARFGEEYHDYMRDVPMWLPWIWK